MLGARKWRYVLGRGKELLQNLLCEDYLTLFQEWVEGHVAGAKGRAGWDEFSKVDPDYARFWGLTEKGFRFYFKYKGRHQKILNKSVTNMLVYIFFRTLVALWKMDWQEYGVRRQLAVTQRRNTCLNKVKVAELKRTRQSSILQPHVAPLADLWALRILGFYSSKPQIKAGRSTSFFFP